jgi:HK97 family phage major capsid protein/HK97 family phage prohead protease
MTRQAVPLLFNHDWDDPIGMIDAGRVADRRLNVDAHLFDTARAAEVAAMLNGGLRNVSVGYRIHEAEEDRKTNEIRVTDWEPYEVSIVTVPADPSVGFGRASGQEFEVSIRSINPAISAERSAAVTDSVNASAGVSAENKTVPNGAEQKNAMAQEKDRHTAIANMCRATKIDDSIRDYWIGSGLPLAEITNEAADIVAQRTKATERPASELGLTQRETQRFSLFKAIQATVDKNWTNAGFELECTREIAKRLNKVPDPQRFYVPLEVQDRSVAYQRGATFAANSTAGRAIRDVMQRDLTVVPASAGGYLVATDNVSFIELLRNRAVAYRMGATRLPGLVGNVTVPKQTAAATAYWLASESTAITESNQTFGQLALSPKTVGAYTEISRLLLLQSSPGAEGIVTSDLAAVTALAYDLGVLSGSGAAGQPTGITATSGIGSVVGTTIDFAKVLEFQTDVASNNVVPTAGGYVTTHAVAALLIQRVKYTNTASPIWEGNVWEGMVQGFPGLASNQMAAGTMLFGDWAQVVVGEWGVLEIEVNPFANFQAGIIGVRAIVSMDCGLRYPAAFSYATTIT